MVPSNRFLTITLSAVLFLQAVIAAGPLPGKYTIKNVASNGKLALGTVPIGYHVIQVNTDPSSTDVWDLSQGEDGDYMIKPASNPALVLRSLDGRLFASPESSGRWKLIQDERNGPNSFVIASPSAGFMEAWKADDDEDGPAPVSVGLLPVGRSLPPFYPPIGVWILEPETN